MYGGYFGGATDNNERDLWGAGNVLHLNLDAYSMGVPFVVIHSSCRFACIGWLVVLSCIHLSVYEINFH